MPRPHSQKLGHLRKEGREKVTGQAHYIDDISMPEMLHGVTVRSKVARGKITKITFDPAISWHEFTIVTAKDIPGHNYVALILNDQPYLVDETINHLHEAVVLLAHPDKAMAIKARDFVHIETKDLPAVFTIQDSIEVKNCIWGKDNVFKSFLVDKGDVDSIWKTATSIGAHIVEEEYWTGAQEHLYIEPQGVISTANAKEGVTVWGSLQCPYYVHKALLQLFNLPDDKIRVIQTETGGGFGGKEEYPSMIAGHAALLAWKSGKPVKIIYDRAEDMIATTKRHPSHTRHRTAVSKDGKLLAVEIDFTLDGGAYATLSAVVLSRGTIHASGPYDCPNIRIKSRVVATNTPPHGAFRGFGAPQSIFALERHMDAIARKLKMEPTEFRRRNFLQTGQTTATGQVIKEKIDMNSLMESALKHSNYFAKKSEFARTNPNSRTKKGIGIATFMHGAGFTGSGERYLASVAAVEATASGQIRVLASSTEIGQGTNTIFAQIASESLGIAYDMIDVVQPDTRVVPNSGPTVASRTVMIVGKLIENACHSLRDTLIASGMLASPFDEKAFKKACGAYIEKFGPLKCTSQYKQPSDVTWDDETYRGDAYATYAWAAYVAEVSVDTVTYATQVDDFVAVQEVGRVMHPVLAAGQIEGGVAQGIGYALYENIVWRDGAMANANMTNYIIPTSADTPVIRVFFAEEPSKHGPGGAKGIGELPLDGGAPAILNAIEDATGIRVSCIPCTPEAFFAAKAKQAKAE